MYSSLFFYFVQGNLPIPISSSPPTKSSSSINWTIISETVVSCSMAPPHAVVVVVSFGRQVARVGWQLSSTGVGSLDVGMTWSHSLYIHSCVADRFWCQSCKKIYLVSSVWNNKTENKVIQNGRHRFKILYLCCCNWLHYRSHCLCRSYCCHPLYLWSILWILHHCQLGCPLDWQNYHLSASTIMSMIVL